MPDSPSLFSVAELRAKAERHVVYPLNRDDCLWLVEQAESAARYREVLERIAGLPDISNSARRRADFLAREALDATPGESLPSATSVAQDQLFEATVAERIRVVGRAATRVAAGRCGAGLDFASMSLIHLSTGA